MGGLSDFRKSLGGRTFVYSDLDGDGLPEIGWPVMIWRAVLTKRAAGWNLVSESYNEPSIMKDQLKSGFTHVTLYPRAYRSYSKMAPEIAPAGITTPGVISYYVPACVFSDRKTAIHSEIWEVKYDNCGNIYQPIQRLERYKISDAIMFREGPPIQYWKLICEKQEI